MNYDCIIIGAGPAGITAAIYADRAGLKTLVLEKLFVGGQVVNTAEVDNYPGFKNIMGADLVMKMEDHLKSFEVDFKREEALKITLDNDKKTVVTKKGEYTATTLILAMGSKPRYLNIQGEEEFRARGVSYCGTCDGALYRGKDVVVIGGGNSALEDAIFLSRMCNKVHLIHRRDEFRADKKIIKNLLNIKNVVIHYDCVGESIGGSNTADHIIIKNVKTGETKKIDTSCVFIAIGQIPNNKLVENLLETDELGYITTNLKMETNQPGVFAAGDGRSNVLKQVVVAAGEGALAAYGASVYIATN